MNRPFKTIRHLLLLLATAAAALCPGDSWADEVMYIDELGMPQTVDATKLTSGTTTINVPDNAQTYYYVSCDDVSDCVTIDGDLTITGGSYSEFHLILCDGASLTVTGNIISTADIMIYAQSTGNEISGNNTGQLNVLSADDNAILSSSSILFYGGRIALDGGVTADYLGFIAGQFTASKVTANFAISYHYASDFIQVGTYVGKVHFYPAMMIGEDPTNYFYNTDLSASDDKTIINGKKLSPHPSKIITVSIDPSITGGTVSADRATAVVSTEDVTLTLTPAAGFELTDAAWSVGEVVVPISASDLATAQSTGKWIFSPNLYGLGGSDVIFSATFTPLAASITSGGTTTYFASLAAAIEAGDGETVDVLRQIDESATNYDHSSNYRDVTIDLHGYDVKFGELHKKGPLTIKSTEAGGKFTASVIDNDDEVSVVGTTLVCTTSLVSITNVTFTNSTATIYDLNNGNNSDHLTLTNSTVTTTNSLQWYSDYITLSGGSRLILNGGSFFVGDGSHTLSLNIDNTSLMRFIECTINGYGTIEAPLSAYLSAADATNLHVDGSTKNNLVLRGTWSLELKNGLNEISAGVPAATVTYFDGGTTAPKPYDPNDDTSFRPANYPGANEITAINNSDGQDHYIIMHIVPHKGDIADPDDPDYWTDERLLYVMEGASAASRSRGPGISLNLPYLLKADEYDANLDPTDPDIQPRHDGAGWYYYLLPASHNVANGYTKSTLQGLAAPVFDMETVSLAQDLETGVVTLSRTTDAWTAELTYDRLHWPFTGTIDDTDKPKLKKLVMKYGGSALITLDTTPASESASDEAKAAAAQAEINAQIAHNYPFVQASLEWNQQQIGSGNAYGWFKRTNYDSYFWIDVPLTPLTEPTTANPAGSANNPWLIRNADELNMLSKCLTEGYWLTEKKYFRQTANIDMSSITDFQPIGVRNPGPSFLGHYDGFGNTISNLSVTYSTALNPLDPTEAYVGLFGLIEGNSDAKASVENVTLKNCSFSATAGSSAVAVGGIAGMVEGSNPPDATISNCKVLGSTEVSGLSTGCATGAIVGSLSIGTLSHNYYGYGVTVANASGTAEGYTPRGLWMGTVPLEGGTPTYKWTDFSTTTNVDGAVLWVKKAKLPDATTSGSTVSFRQTTTPADADATHPADCYSFSGNEYYYAVDQPLTLSVSTGSASPDGVRTYYDELESLTMKDGTADTDIKDALGFTMPGADLVTIEATFTPSKWFTINTVNYNADDPSQPHAYNWMTFYHEWTDGTGTAAKPANYKVTNYDNPLLDVEVMTVSRVNSADGTFALAEIDGGICYSGVPTIFHYAVDNDATAVLPQKLKFTPVDPNDPQAPTGGYAEPTVAKQFQGTVSGKTLSATDKCYVLNNVGDFILAYPTDGDDKIAAHKSYIDLSIEDNGNTQAPARLVSVGDETGIGSMVYGQWSIDNPDGPWYSLDGRRLNGQPTRKGIYIYKGKKTVIK